MLTRSLFRATAVAAAMAAPLTAGLIPAHASTHGWRIVNTLGPLNGSTSVGQLVATGPGDAWSTWASCGPCTGSKPGNRTYFRHWNGSAWRDKPVPRAFSAQNLPAAFAARSSSDAWAFGDNRAGKPVSAHWNGSTWTVRRLPSWVLRITRSGDFDVTAAVFRHRNMWVFSGGAESRPTLAAHYHGGRWHQVTLPAVPVSVTAPAATDIWVTGVTVKSFSLAPHRHVLVAMHWNGKSWRTIGLPKPRLPRSSSYEVAGQPVVIGPRDVWLVDGVSTNGNPPKDHLLHWNGKRWIIRKLGYATSYVQVMAQDGHGGLWLMAFGPAPGYVSYFYHFNSGRWSRTRVPAASGSIATQVMALTWIPGTRSLWAAGYLVEKNGLVGVTLKYGP